MSAVVVRHGGVVVSGADHDTDAARGCQDRCMATEDLASSIGITCATVLTVGLFALCVFG